MTSYESFHIFYFENFRFELDNNFQVGPLSSTPPSVHHISSTQKGHAISAPKIPQFHTKNPSVPHQKIPQFHTKTLSVPHQKLLSSNLLSTTPKTPKFHTPLSSTSKTPQFNTVFVWGVCWTERFLVRHWGGLNCRVFGVELRGL